MSGRHSTKKCLIFDLLRFFDIAVMKLLGRGRPPEASPSSCSMLEGLLVPLYKQGKLKVRLGEGSKGRQSRTPN